MTTKLARGSASGAGQASTGRIQWSWDAEGAVGGRYRVRNVAPFRWELTFRDRAISEHHRLSSARVAAELHHRRLLRRADLIRWGALATVSLVVMPGLGAVGGAVSILGIIAAVWVFATALPRLLAALTGNLLDPFRRRDPWEPPDWWNRNP